MNFYLSLKAAILWFIIALFAIANGIFRESFLEPYLGDTLALPLSGITLSMMIVTITFFSFRLIQNHSSSTYLYIGLQWVIMTLIFEFIFGHFVMGISWQELLQVFNIFEGNLFILALLISLFSPLLVSRVRKDQ